MGYRATPLPDRTLPLGSMDFQLLQAGHINVYKLVLRSGKPNGLGAGDCLLQPFLRLTVQWRILVACVHQKIDVDDDHFLRASLRVNSSSSIAAAVANALSQLKYRSEPIE